MTEVEPVSAPSDEDDGEDVAPKAKKGRPERYEWTRKFVCDHSGSYRDRRKPNLSPSKRRSHRAHDSIKCGCTAQFTTRKPLNSDAVEVEFKWKHTGHEAYSLKNMQESRMSERVRAWVQERVLTGLDWRGIKDLLRLDELMLEEVSVCPLTVNEVLTT